MARHADSHQALLAAMEIGGREQPHQALLQFADKHSLSDALASLPRAHRESLSSLLHEHLASTLRTGAYADESDATPAARDASLAALSLLADALAACVQQWSLGDGAAKGSAAGARSAAPALSATLFQSLQLFHDALLSLPHPHASALQNRLSQLFERVWARQPTVRATAAVPDADARALSCDALLPMTLSYLLLRCLEVDTDGGGGGGKRSDVARLFAMRDGLTQFDWDDESTGGLVQLLLRAAMSPLFLRCVEGRRFLSFALVGLGLGSASGRANADMMRTMHGVFKHQLPMGKASLLPLVADVYVRAWRQCGSGGSESAGAAADAGSAAGQQLASFEEEVVQDLMHLSIHSAHPRTARALQQLLTLSFHDPATKRMRGVDEMLARLYEPILWRALKAANPLVRRHAALVLIDVFPLVNPDANNAGGSAAAASSSSSFSSNDDLLQHQLDSLVSLLSDPDVSIRALGVSGICKVLSAYWEMLPLGVCKRLLARVADMVHDAAPGAAAVRAAVFHGLAYLLDNALSHPLLRVLLPTLQSSLFDSSEAVQLSLVDLLHVVKRLRGLSYYEVVPVDLLLLSIQTSRSPKLVRRTLALLINSYFPGKKPMESVLVRVLSLLRSNAHVFAIAMAHLHEHTDALPDQRRVEFVCALYEMLVRNAKEQRAAIRAGTTAVAAGAVSDARGRKASKKAKTSDAGSSGSADADAASDPLRLDVSSEMGLIETALGALVSLYRQLPPALLEEGSGATAERVASCFADGGVSVLLATLGASSASARLSLIHLSALLPPACSPDLREISMPHLLSLSPSAPHADYAPVLECMAAWGRIDEILLAVHQSLHVGFDDADARCWFEARAKLAADRDDREAKEALEQMERQLQQEYQEQYAALLPQPKHNAAVQSGGGKGLRGKKAASGAALLATDVEELPLLHPLMALKYLSFLLEHDKTRALVLGAGVEWRMAAQEGGDGGGSGGSGGGVHRAHGRCVGALGAILDLLSLRLAPACKTIVEESDPSLPSSPGQRARMAFVHQALQTTLKANLHVHARIRLLAQRANQMAAEAAEAAATAALAALDVAESSSSSSAGASAPPAVWVESLELFPRDFESMMDLSTYVLLPHWTALVDRPTTTKEPSSDAQAKEEREEKEEKNAHAAKGSKKGKAKKKKTTAAASAADPEQPSAVDSPSVDLSSPSSFLRAHFLFLATFSTELLTLGYFHPHCPLRHWQAWMDQLVDMRRTDANDKTEAAAAAAAAAAADSASVPSFGAETRAFLSALLPLGFKTLFQLSVIGAATAGFGDTATWSSSGASTAAAASGGEVDSALSPSSAQLSFPVYASFVRSLLTLLGCSGVGAALLPAAPLIRAGVVESLAQFDRAPAVQARVLWAALEAVVDDERYGACEARPDWLLPLQPAESSSELPPFALLLLTAVCRSPSCVSVLPRALASLAERLAVAPPSNERRLLRRLGAAVGALAQLADAHVKMEQKRRACVATLLRGADQLATMAAVVSIAEPEAQAAREEQSSAPSGAVSPARPAGAGAGAAAAVLASPSGPVPMDMDDEEEQEEKAGVKKEEQQAAGGEATASPAPAATRLARNGAGATPRSTRTTRRRPLQPRAAEADGDAADADSAMWSALRQSLADKVAALQA